MGKNIQIRRVVSAEVSELFSFQYTLIYLRQARQDTFIEARDRKCSSKNHISRLRNTDLGLMKKIKNVNRY